MKQSKQEEYIQKLESRITELEIRYAYQENTIFALDQVIQEYCKSTDELKRRIKSLEDKSAIEELPQQFSPKQEVPPHY